MKKSTISGSSQTTGLESLTYEQALARGEQVGASKAGPQEFLALICKTLASLHAINPALVYEGARKRRLTAKQVARLAADDPVALGDLMFVQQETRK